MATITRQCSVAEPATDNKTCDPLRVNHLQAGQARIAGHLKRLAYAHDCWKHPLFEALASCLLDRRIITSLLANYDAHATALRRLLLQAATIMPEEAVGFVLENVRNEYGNGNPDWRHQLQLIDLAHCAGVSDSEFALARIRPQIRSYIKQVTPLYYPTRHPAGSSHLRPAIAGGAIAATEILALREFEYLQKSFAKLGLSNHIWFNHVTIEAEHSDESLALALFFIEKHQAIKEVEQGMNGVLNANVTLYDGLLATLQS